MQAIFGYTMSAFCDPLLHRVVSPSAAEKGSNEVAATWSDVKEAALQGRGKAKARIENVAYWR